MYADKKYQKYVNRKIKRRLREASIDRTTRPESRTCSYCHGVGTVEPFWCIECEKWFDSRGFRNHERMHRRDRRGVG